ncbi:MAG: galactose ABC transporter substrate-binding protein [Bacillales bacterium]|jgi:methyl-galactoside transport system substrate-binding protein|nr:galactose ABC transporter substrate-binding protein [Bacillales bacterium]
MKKVIYFSLLFLFLISCKSKKITIGILIYDESDTFMGEYTNNIIEQLPEQVSYTINYSENSQALQNEQLISFLQKGVDLMIVNPVDRLACKSITELCAKNNVSLIFINREPLLSDISFYEDVYYVGSDPKNQGISQAQMIANLFGSPNNLNYDRNADNKIQLLVLKGEQNHQDAESRTRFALEELNKLGYELEVLDIQVCNWRRQEAYTTIKSLYSLYGAELELIIANNDDMALGAIDYFKEIDLFKSSETFEQPIVVVGVDGTKVGVDSVNQGLMYGTILNDSLSQSKAVISLLRKILNLNPEEVFPYAFENNKFIYIAGEKITQN